MDGGTREVQGALAPFAHRAFAVLWTATLVSNVGTWMRDVGLGWTMAELSASPVAVSAVQTAASLPVLLLALPAGALADILDRRHLMIAAQAGLCLLSAVLAVLSWLGLLTPTILLGAAALGGIGAALAAPAWQSSVPGLVPRPVLRSASALNVVGFNLARAIGPALGGVVLAAAGATAAFALDALSVLVLLAALAWWRPARPAAPGVPERFGGALRAGLRYAWHRPELRRVLLRAGLFFVPAAAPWALLPLVAREVPGGDAGLYGLLLASAGLGAVAGAAILPRLRGRLSPSAMVAAGTAGAAAAAVALAPAGPPAIALGACFVFGLSWIAAVTTLNLAAQAALPDWVRARGLALYLATFSGAVAAGGLLWGTVAQAAGVPAALLGAAGAGLFCALAARRIGLPEGGDDLLPSGDMPGHADWPAPPAPEAGPVLIQVEYRLRAPAERAALLEALAPLEAERRRDGAEAWWAFADPLDRTRIVEVFLFPSWAEHELMHARATQAGHALHAAANALDISGRPRVQHLLGLPVPPVR